MSMKIKHCIKKMSNCKYLVLFLEGNPNLHVNIYMRTECRCQYSMTVKKLQDDMCTFTE